MCPKCIKHARFFMSMPGGILPSFNTNFDFNDSCNCCFPSRKKKEREIKTSDVAAEVLTPESQVKKTSAYKK